MSTSLFHLNLLIIAQQVNQLLRHTGGHGPPIYWEVNECGCVRSTSRNNLYRLSEGRPSFHITLRSKISSLWVSDQANSKVFDFTGPSKHHRENGGLRRWQNVVILRPLWASDKETRNNTMGPKLLGTWYVRYRNDIDWLSIFRQQ